MKLILPLLVLAKAQGPSIDTYLTVRTPSAIAWSRDGSRLAIQLTNLDGSEVRIVDANGQNRVTVARSIAPGRYTVDRPDLVWSRDGQQLFYRAGAQYYMVPASGGSPRPLLTDTLPREVVQLAPDQSAVSFIRDGDIWVQSLSGGAPRKVSEGEKLLAALPDFFGRLQQWPRWSPDSRRIAFSSPWRPGSFSGSRVAVADVTSGTTRYVTPTDSTWAFTQVEWSPDSRSLAVSRLSSDYRVKELVVVADTGGAEWKVRRDSSDKWIAHNIEPSFSPAWSPDGKRLAFVSIASGWRQLYVADRSGGGTKQVTRGEFEVAAPSWSPDGRAILSVSTRDHPQAPRPLVIDPATGAAASLDTTLGSASDAWWPGYMTGPAWSPDSRRIAYALSSSADPYQVRTVTRTAAGYSTPASAHSALAEGLEPGVVMPLEAVSFPGKDGTTLRGVLYRARRPGTGPRPPALVHMYGGWGQLATMGWDIAFKSRLFQYLASRGYAVLVVDPRGSDGYGSAFAHGLYHDAAGKQSDDLAAAAGFLAGTGHADPERIALFGHSYGAFLTLATMLKTPGVFAAGVLQAGVFDFPLFIPLAVQYASMRFGTAATYEARGRPARHVDQLTAPVLVAHGTADFNAPHIGSEILVTELMRANKDFEFISYPGERHDWERPESARDFVRRVTAFLDRAMPARMKVGQAPSTRPVVVEGRNGMVVGTTGAPAVREGAKVLREGGTAMDAALTTALTQIALAAGSWVSYAGFMTLVHYDAATGKVEAMNAGFNTVREETDPLTIPTMGNASGRTALVPGLMAGVEAAHRRFGRLPFARLFAPAIEVAERGIPVDAMVGGMIAQRRPVLSRLEETRRIFTKANGEFYAVGDQFVQKELAVTLRKVAAEGAAYMYRGPWAERLVALVRRDGGKMTLDDLASYKVIWGQPVRTTIREFEVYATGLPNVGGIATLEALNLIEAADLRKRPHYSTSADALYDLMQISRAPITLGPAAMGGAPAELVAKYFPTLKPGSGALLSKDAARVAWGTIGGPGWKAFDSTLRVVNASENSDVVEGILKSVRRPPSHSDAVVAVDSAGNMVALVHTINTVTWGTTGIFVDGISIPDAATFQQAAIKAVGPGNRVPEQTNPLLVLKSGRPYFASSSIGSGLFQTTVQSLHNVLDFGMHPQMAVDTAQFLKNEWLPKEAHILTAPPGAFRAALLDSVRARGQPVREVPPAGQGLLRGYWVGITRDAVTGMWRGGRSSGLNGSVEAY